MSLILQSAGMCRHTPFAPHQLATTQRNRFRLARAGERPTQISIPEHKKAAAKMLVDMFVKDNTIVGISSGETVAAAVDYLSQKLQVGLLQGVQCLAANDTAATEAAFCGVPLASLDQVTQVDVMLEEADLVDAARNAVLIGRKSEPTQPQLVRERMVAKMAKQLVVIVDSPSQVVEQLQGSLPLLIKGDDWEESAEQVDDIFLGDAELWRRPSKGVADPRGGPNPYVSTDGNVIVDVRFYEGFLLYGEPVEYDAIQQEVMNVPGVLATGLLVNMADTLVVLQNGGEPQLVPLSKSQSS